MREDRIDRWLGKHHKYLVVILLLLLFAQAITSIPQLSVTFDEPVHVLTGYSIWRTGDLRLLEDHPPLLELWMSWPLLCDPDLPSPEQVSTWETGDRRLFAHHDVWWEDIDGWLMPARMTTVLLAMVLAALVYRWAVDAFGVSGGLLVLFLLTFDPNFLAHARLATLDLGVTLLMFATLYVFQRTLKSPSMRDWLCVGALLGLALASKASALILLPVMGIAMLWWGWKHWQPMVVIGYVSLCFGVALLVLWGVHGFDIGVMEGRGFTVPFPTYFRSVLRIGSTVTAESGRRAYLLGETYGGGHWAYFPVVFLLKTPLAALILFGLALLSLLRTPRAALRNSPSWIPAAICALYIYISINSQINIGYRHLIPLLPFMYLLIARLAVVRNANHHHRWLHWLIGGLLLWQTIGTLGIWPWHLTYFNALAGGPQNGYHHLADSNVDWGQALKATRAYLEGHGLTDAYLSHFTYFLQPEDVYGIQARPLPPAQGAPAILPQRNNPEPGTYIISASSLHGLQGVDPEGYNWFVHQEPDDIIANAMLVYEVPEPTSAPTWLAQCSSPVVPLAPEQVDERFGVNGLRMASFDCTRSWLYPAGGTEPGWYILHAEILQHKSEFATTSLAGTDLSFEQNLYRESPALSVYTWPAGAASPATRYRTDNLRAASALWPVSQAAEQGTLVSAPVDFEGPLAFLGYTISDQEQGIELVTYWQVSDSPRTLFSIMAHFMGADSAPLGVGDGLGVPVDQMLVGDILAQRHTFTLPAQCKNEGCWFKIGAYWLDTMERWTLDSNDPAVDALYLPLQ